MRIIKEGRDPKLGHMHISVCGHCKTEFKWNTNEAIRVPDQRDGDFYKMACPLCSAQVNVDARLAEGKR